MNDPDPRPQPPEKPIPGDCCDSGCERCVQDIYVDELEYYEQQLAAWLARHPEAPDQTLKVVINNGAGGKAEQS